MRLNKNMKFVRSTFRRTAVFLYIMCIPGLVQGATACQEHDSAQQNITGRGTIAMVSSHDGLDANQYMAEVFGKLNSQHAIQAENLRVDKPGKLVVEFAILRDGNVDYTKVIKSTVDRAAAQTQMDAIRTAAPFPPLPNDFKGKSLKLRLYSEFTAQKPSPSAN